MPLETSPSSPETQKPQPGFNEAAYEELKAKAESPEAFVQELDGAGTDILTVADVGKAAGLLFGVLNSDGPNNPFEPFRERGEAEFAPLERYYDEVTTLERFRDEAQAKALLAKLIGDYLNDVVEPIVKVYKEYTDKTPEEKRAYLLTPGNMDKVGLNPDIAYQVLNDFSNDSEVIDLFLKTDPDFFERSPRLELLQFVQTHSDTYLSSKLKEHCPEIDTQLVQLEKAEQWIERSQHGLSLNGLMRGYFDFSLLKDKEFIHFYFEFSRAFMTHDPNVAYAAMDVFNQLYESGYGAQETDQLEIAETLPARTLMEMLANCTEHHLNISHKILMWHLIGNPSKEIPGKPKTEILAAFREMPVEARENFMLGNMKRSGRDAYFLSIFDAKEQEEFLQTSVDGLVRHYGNEIANAPGLETAINDPTSGKVFSKLLIQQLERTVDPEALPILFVISPALMQAAQESGIPIDQQKLEEARERVEKTARFDAEAALRDGEYRSVTMFAWDPEHTQDKQGKDKWMQLSDFYDTFKTLKASGYAVTEVVGKDGKTLPISKALEPERTVEGKKRLPLAFETGEIQKVVFAKEIGGIRVVNEIMLSNNNSHGDFRALAEARGDEGAARYDQIAIRGHCWSNEEAILGQHSGGADKPIDRDQHLLLINGGCFQERNVPEFSRMLQGQDFQVATAQTGLGSLVTKPMAIEYQERIVGRYVETQAGVDLRQIDAEVSERFAKVFENSYEARGYTLTTNARRLMAKLSLTIQTPDSG